MSGQLEMRAQGLADDAVARWRERVADRLRGIGGIDVEVRDDGVVAQGRRLKARWLRDARLRWLGGWM